MFNVSMQKQTAIYYKHCKINKSLGSKLIVNKVSAAGIKPYGLTLVCDRQTPAWMNKDAKGNPLGREEALDNLKIHIKMKLLENASWAIST